MQAVTALKSCPVEMTDPDQALTLKGVGPAVVSHIRKKLQEKHRMLGLPLPDRGNKAFFFPFSRRLVLVVMLTFVYS